MRFWDASAIVPLVLTEAPSPETTAEYRRDPGMAVWWATDVECVSAICRRERDGALSADGVARAIERLDKLTAAWAEIDPTLAVRRGAIRLLRVHALRATDALQLAAAAVASESEPRSLPFVTLDDRLAQAAAREGFPVVRPA